MPSTSENASNSPKSLTGEASVTLHTHYALRALRGRRGDKSRGIDEIIGLFPFTAHMNLIYNAAQADDPFAMAALVRLENQLQRVHQWLERKMRHVAKRLTLNADQIALMRPTSTEPVTLRLNVSHYGFCLLDEIVLFDKLACDILNAMHRSRISTLAGRELLVQASAKVRQLASCVSSYRYTGVQRQDLVLKTQLAQAAVDKLTETTFITAVNFAGFDDIVQYYLGLDQLAEFGPVVKPGGEPVREGGPRWATLEQPEG